LICELLAVEYRRMNDASGAQTVFSCPLPTLPYDYLTRGAGSMNG
jgi:hypothetical protein